MRGLRYLLVAALGALSFVPPLLAVPVIEAGREQDVLALLRPYQLAGDVRPGWRLWNIRIDVNNITVEIAGPGGVIGTLRLVHRQERQAGAETTESFAIGRDEVSSQGEAALAAGALIEAIRRNDTGGFWRVDRGLPLEASRGGLRPHFGHFALVTDGIVLFALLVVALLWVLHEHLRISRQEYLYILIVTLLGAMLRLGLSPKIALGPWFGRFHAHVERVYFGPVFSAITNAVGSPIYLTDVMSWTNFAYAVLAPAAIFAFAKVLLGDSRPAMIAAVLLALLPQHLRYSLSEVGFIPTITIACVGLCLSCMALTAERLPTRLAAAIGAFCCLWGLLPLLPLNILFVPLFAAIPWVVSHRSSSRWATLIAIVLFALGCVVGLPALFERHAGDVGAALRPAALIGGTLAQLLPAYNSLLNPNVTPPAYILFALIGAISLWRQGRGRELAYMTLWMGASLVTHAYVLDVQMQPRYHLHLIVPFVLLVAAGAWELVRYSRKLAVVVAAYAILSVALHAGFVTDTDFTDLREWQFVMQIRERIPAECAVVEFNGTKLNLPARFDRAGQQAERRNLRSRFISVPLEAKDLARDGSAPRRWVDALDQHDCLYVYEGVACWLDRQSATRSAAACESLRHHLDLTPVASTAFRPRTYDANLTMDGPDGPERIELSLYRAWDRRERGGEKDVKVVERKWPPVATYALALLGFGWCLVQGFRRLLRGAPLPMVLAGPVLFIVLVSTLGTTLPFHDHNSFVTRSDCAHELGCDEDPRAPGWMAPTFHVYGAIFRLLPYRLGTLGAVSVGLTAISLILLGWFVTELASLRTGDGVDRSVAAWVGVMLALHPIFLRVAGAGSFWPYAMCCLFGAGAALLVAVRVGSRLGMAAAAALFALAMTTNLSMLALLPLLILAPALWFGRWKLTPFAAGLVLAVLVFLAPYFATGYAHAFGRADGRLLGRAESPAGLVVELVDEFQLAFLDPSLTALPLGACLALSVVPVSRALPIFAPPLYALAALAGPLAATSGPPVSGTYPSGFLHTFPTLYLQALFAAFGAAWLCGKLRQPWRSVASSVLVGAVILNAPLASEGWAALRQRRVLDREIAALSAAFDSLPEHDVLVIPPPIQENIGGGRRDSDPVEAAFPIGEYRYVQSKRLLFPAELVDTGQFLERTGQLSGKRVLVYIGSTLRSFIRSEIRAGVVPPNLERPLLTELKTRCRLTPVHEFEVSTAQHPAISMRLAADRVDRVTLGFYWAECKPVSEEPPREP